MKFLTTLSLLVVLFVPFIGESQTVNNYTFTGGPEFFTVPNNVNMIFVTASGAAGGCDTLGGAGAEVCDSLPVSPGMVLQINVGGMAVDTIGGYNGGGAGGNAADPANMACGGGGSSDVRVPPYALGDRILVAGGGGGKGGGPGNVGEGGDAECPNGVNGGNGFTTGGFGATDSTFGIGGAPWGGGAGGTDGALGVGGNGGVDPCFDMAPGGGGGGGWYGGGGGATDCFGTGTAAGGGGGGGSSYYSANGCCTPGANAGAGSIIIAYYEPVGFDTELEVPINIYFDRELQVAKIEASGSFIYEVFTIKGSLLTSGSGYEKASIPMKAYQKGIYLIHVVQKDRELTEKIAY